MIPCPPEWYVVTHTHEEGTVYHPIAAWDDGIPFPFAINGGIVIGPGDSIRVVDGKPVRVARRRVMRT